MREGRGIYLVQDKRLKGGISASPYFVLLLNELKHTFQIMFDNGQTCSIEMNR